MKAQRKQRAASLPACESLIQSKRADGLISGSISKLRMEAMNRKEKEQVTRSRLMAATEAVFSRRGYAQATVDEIISLADTGKGTLYKYFGNKDNLFYTLVSQKHEKLMQDMRLVADDAARGIEDRLIGILAVWIEFIMKNTVLWQVLCFEMTRANRGYSGVRDEAGNLRLAARWGDLPGPEEQENVLRYHRLLAEEAEPITRVYREGIGQHFFNKTAEHEDIAQNIFFAVAMLIFVHTESKLNEIGPQELAENVVRLRLYGLCNPA